MNRIFRNKNSEKRSISRFPVESRRRASKISQQNDVSWNDCNNDRRIHYRGQLSCVQGGNNLT